MDCSLEVELVKRAQETFDVASRRLANATKANKAQRRKAMNDARKALNKAINALESCRKRQKRVLNVEERQSGQTERTEIRQSGQTERTEIRQSGKTARAPYMVDIHAGYADALGAIGAAVAPVVVGTAAKPAPIADDDDTGGHGTPPPLDIDPLLVGGLLGLVAVVLSRRK